MNFTSIPIIVICCYMIGEIYKICFKQKKEAYNLIPILVSLFGGLLGIVIYYTAPEMILDAKNGWVAFGIGIISGASATSTNQIIKQLFISKKRGRK